MRPLSISDAVRLPAAVIYLTPLPGHQQCTMQVASCYSQMRAVRPEDPQARDCALQSGHHFPGQVLRLRQGCLCVPFIQFSRRSRLGSGLAVPQDWRAAVPVGDYPISSSMPLCILLFGHCFNTRQREKLTSVSTATPSLRGILRAQTATACHNPFQTISLASPGNSQCVGP